MSRQEQINAELASNVPLEQQKAALLVKECINDELQEMISDDEAILIFADHATRFANYSNSLQNWCIVIGFGGVFLGMLGQSGLIAFGSAALAFVAYFGLKKQRHQALPNEILVAMCAKVDGRISNVQVSKQAVATPNVGAFDVPPQDG